MENLSGLLATDCWKAGMTDQDSETGTIREPSLLDALIPLVYLVIMLTWMV